MNKEIENIIKKNLPEEIDTSKLEPLEEKIFANGINYLLKQIDISLASLIADEVLKVVVEKIKDFEEQVKCPYNCFPRKCSHYETAISNIRILLSNLSPNKENKNNG